MYYYCLSVTYSLISQGLNTGRIHEVLALYVIANTAAGHANNVHNKIETRFVLAAS
jgi:hypothetical protein